MLTPQQKEYNMEDTQKSRNVPDSDPFATDTLSETIGILARRETEARILIPIIQDLSEKIGKEAVVDCVSKTIIRIAKEQGCHLAQLLGANDAATFRNSLALWSRDGALEIEIKEASETRIAFDVTRCRYADMYKALGARDLGAIFSCNRDAALIKGFNPEVKFVRTQTIMAGAPFCDFVYKFPASEKQTK